MSHKASTPMSHEAVKYLIDNCLIQVAHRVPKHQIEQARDIKALEEYVLSRMATSLGAEIMGRKADKWDEWRPNDACNEYRAEVYALSEVDMQRVYTLMRKEIRQEDPGESERMTTSAVIKVIEALAEEDRFLWEEDAYIFAQELIKRFKERGRS